MSGGLTWARVEPSTNSTIECTTDCGWTTTSIRSNPTPKSRWASITSRPLLTSVAEFVVTSGPMDQVGWARACSGPTSASEARSRPRNGPPEAVRTSRRTSAERPPRRHWASAECSESTGTTWSGAASASHQVDPDDEGLLVGQRQHVAGLQRSEGGAQADRAGQAVEHDVGRDGGQLRSGLLAGQHLDPPARAPQRSADLHGDRLLADRHDGCVVGEHLIHQQPRVTAARGQTGDGEVVAVSGDDVERLGADGARGAKHRDASHAAECASGDGTRRHGPAGRTGAPAPVADAWVRPRPPRTASPTPGWIPPLRATEAAESARMLRP